MALQSTSGILLPPFPPGLVNPPAYTSSAISASTHRMAWSGAVQTPNRGSKSIQKIGFLTGAITSAGGSTARLSLQDVDAATGQPARPDGTQDQTVDFLLSAPTANSWYTTANLSATRTVSHGDMLSVVIEFQSFAGSDALNVRNLAIGSSIVGNFGFSTYNGTTWSNAAVLNNVLLVFDDGTFGSLGYFSFISDGLTTDAINTGSTPDEVALQFSVPFPCKLDGAWAAVASNASGRNFSVILYQGTTALATVSVDAEYTQATTARLMMVQFSEQTLSANTTYYLAVRPNSASNNTIYSFTVNASGHFQAHAGGTGVSYASRTDAGAWSNTAVKRLLAGVIISALDDGAQTGSSGVIGG